MQAVTSGSTNLQTQIR